MSVLIKGMEMPTAGTGKVIMIDSEGDVWAAGKDEYTIIDGAKAVPFPPHGRLADLDKIENEIAQLSPEDYTTGVIRLILDCAPTIIPAEEATE